MDHEHFATAFRRTVLIHASVDSLQGASWPINSRLRCLVDEGDTHFASSCVAHTARDLDKTTSGFHLHWIYNIVPEFHQKRSGNGDADSLNFVVQWQWKSVSWLVSACEKWFKANDPKNPCPVRQKFWIRILFTPRINHLSSWHSIVDFCPFQFRRRPWIIHFYLWQWWCFNSINFNYSSSPH